MVAARLVFAGTERSADCRIHPERGKKVWRYIGGRDTHRISRARQVGAVACKTSDALKDLVLAPELQVVAVHHAGPVLEWPVL